MSLSADASAWVNQKLAPLFVRYGRGLTLAGADLPRRRVRLGTRHGRIPAWVYEAPAARGTHVHLHGGAFMMRYPSMDDFLARFVAAEAGCRVVLPDYRVAPQVRYPVAHEQVHDAVLWAAGEWDEPVSVGGFSSGGNLAASAALQARDAGSVTPVLQVLGVPSTDVADDAKRTVTGARSMITPGLIASVRQTYFTDASRRAEAYASPLLAGRLEGLPPALVLTAEHDLLRAEGDAYAARLAEAGVATEHHVVPHADHYFLSSPEQARPWLDLVAGRIREALRG
ncbi:lipase [Marmoricola endophyticus]|uniref:Lipase n=1 Tax=Marmoricola endophyticus TaxID=2040280 RepID=A0A917BHA7_9ACTN|nr:alpha/beta hydrolase [Marmoricola endophyticus]GGF45587.1 lipase [Marmoricola endophyticus]